METRQIRNEPRNEPEISDKIYSKAIITRSIRLHINDVDANVFQTIERVIANMIEQKCITEGYVKGKSVKLLTYSCGKILAEYVVFETVCECFIFYPIPGLLLPVRVNTVTRAGVHCESGTETPSPFVVYISRDQYHGNEYFAKIKPASNIIVRVIAQRFELNDAFISIIAEPVE